MRKILAVLQPHSYSIVSDPQPPYVQVLGPNDRKSDSLGKLHMLHITMPDGNEWTVPVSEITEAVNEE